MKQLISVIVLLGMVGLTNLSWGLDQKTLEKAIEIKDTISYCEELIAGIEKIKNEYRGRVGPSDMPRLCFDDLDRDDSSSVAIYLTIQDYWRLVDIFEKVAQKRIPELKKQLADL